MDLELGEKRKSFEESKKSHKKWKADKTSRGGGLTDNHYNLIFYRMTEVVNETHTKIDDRNRDLVGGITYLLQTLCFTIKEFIPVVSGHPFWSQLHEVIPSKDRQVEVSIPQ